MFVIRSLEDVRKSKGYTQEYMAKNLNVAISTYNQYETGARSIPKEITDKISTLLNVNAEEIFLPTKFTISKIH